MRLDELQKIIVAAGGSTNALDYAEALLLKVNRIEVTNRYRALLKQLCSVREQGDLRGRLLEINFADQFLQKCVELDYGAKQGLTGDVDFCWSVAGHQVYFEIKLIGQDRATRDAITAQLERQGASVTFLAEDIRDVARLQSDLMLKASARKFNVAPESHWINLVAIDVTELQLGSVDICDCLLTAGGNTLASKHCDSAVLRAGVVGMFEVLPAESIDAEQKDWIARVQRLDDGAIHPRNYIHGVIFLFRKPEERAALSYDLSAAVVWNPALIPPKVAQKIGSAFHNVIPCARF